MNVEGRIFLLTSIVAAFFLNILRKLFKVPFSYTITPRDGDTMVKPTSTHTDDDFDKNAFFHSVDLAEALKKLNPHDHLCLVYETEEEWYSTIITFITIGLERNEKLIYVVDIHTASQICDYLRKEGIDVDAAQASGQLTILHETEAYTRDGIFDPDKMIALLAEETRKAIAEGYSALRVTGEMSWALRGHPGSDALIEYEAKLNLDLLPHYPCLAICQYYRKLFDPVTIRHVLMTHPLMVRNNMVYRNPYYIPPEEFLSQKRNYYELEHMLEDLEYHSLVAETIRRSEELEALNKISFTIAQSLDLKKVLNAALEKTLEVLDAEGGIIYLIDESSQTFIPAVYRGVSQAIEEVSGFKMGEGLSGHAAQTGAPVLVSDLAENPSNISPAFLAEGWQSLMSVPLKVEDNLKGVLTVASRVKTQFRPDNLNLLASIGNQVGVAIENAQSYEARQQELRERIRAEEEVMQLSAAVKMSTDSIVIIDMDGDIINANEAALKMYHARKKEDLIGKPVKDIVVPEDYKRVLASFEEVGEKGYCESVECDLLTLDGTRTTVEASMGIMKTAEGIPRGIVSISRDITERKRAEKEMKRKLMRYDLEEGNMYLIQEHMPCTSVEAFQDLLTVDYPGLVLSRTPRKEFTDKVEQEFSYVWIAERGDEPFIPPELGKIREKIETLSKPTALFIDRLDYLLSRTSFKEILTFIQSLREIAYLEGHIVILSVDPSTLSPQELRQIEKETLAVEPLYKTKLPEELVNVLRIVYELSIKGMKPSYTRIGREMGASKPTMRRRIRTLINYGYLEESKKGRTKIVDLTEKGRLFFLR